MVCTGMPGIGPPTFDVVIVIDDVDCWREGRYLADRQILLLRSIVVKPVIATDVEVKAAAIAEAVPVPTPRAMAVRESAIVTIARAFAMITTIRSVTTSVSPSMALCNSRTGQQAAGDDHNRSTQNKTLHD